MIYPDAEVIAREWALNNTNIAAIVGTRVATRLPEAPTFPFLTVFRAGGSRAGDTDAPIDEPLLQWDCYGAKGQNAPDYASASLLARTLVDEADSVTGLEVTHLMGDAFMYGFEIFAGPTRIEEPDTGWARYTVDTILVMRRRL